MKSFFSAAEVKSTKPSSGISKCGSCGLFRTCNSPKMKYVGKGEKKILIVTENPTQEEDRNGNGTYLGASGAFLKECLRENGIDLFEDCWRINAIQCYPGEEVPTDNQILACSPNLIKTVLELQPVSIILLGTVAVKALLSWAWKDSIGSGETWMGMNIPCQKLNSWINPTYSPNFLLKKDDPLYDRMFLKHLKKSLLKTKAPWKKDPEHIKKVEIIINPKEVISIIEEQMGISKTIAFDYETNALKPEIEGAKIVSCSICFDGKKTIAFPFSPSVIPSFVELLKSPIQKIASNLKFEERWSRYHLKTRVRNWYWDTMIAAHVIDNRPEITSIKFQSFVLLGTPSYNDNVKEYLKSKEKSKLNRIHEIPVNELLLYNGLDSLLEYKVAMRQIKILRGINDIANY